MANNMTIDQPIKIESSSKEQTALALLDRIIMKDSRFESESQDRKYWLTLYTQCLKATSNYALDTVLREK